MASSSAQRGRQSHHNLDFILNHSSDSGSSGGASAPSGGSTPRHATPTASHPPGATRPPSSSDNPDQHGTQPQSRASRHLPPSLQAQRYGPVSYTSPGAPPHSAIPGSSRPIAQPPSGPSRMPPSPADYSHSSPGHFNAQHTSHGHGAQHHSSAIAGPSYAPHDHHDMSPYRHPPGTHAYSSHGVPMVMPPVSRPHHQPHATTPSMSSAYSTLPGSPGHAGSSAQARPLRRNGDDPAAVAGGYRHHTGYSHDRVGASASGGGHVTAPYPPPAASSDSATGRPRTRPPYAQHGPESSASAHGSTEQSSTPYGRPSTHPSPSHAGMVMPPAPYGTSSTANAGPSSHTQQSHDQQQYHHQQQQQASAPKRRRKRPESAPCEICGRVFGEAGALTKHRRVVHERVKNYVCTDCGRAFAEKSNMKKHRQAKHGEASNPLPCPDCDKVFYFSDALRRHINNCHLGLRPFACKVQGCNRAFKQRAHLQKHLSGVHGLDS